MNEKTCPELLMCVRQSLQLFELSRNRVSTTLMCVVRAYALGRHDEGLVRRLLERVQEKVRRQAPQGLVLHLAGSLGDIIRL